MKRTSTVEVLPAGVTSRISDAGTETARSVASIVKQFGSHSFTIPTSDGTPVPVSLEHLRNQDPETTLVVVSVRVEAENDLEAANLVAAIDSMPE